MKANFQTALALVLRHEGGYINHTQVGASFALTPEQIDAMWQAALEI